MPWAGSSEWHTNQSPCSCPCRAPGPERPVQPCPACPPVSLWAGLSLKPQDGHAHACGSWRDAKVKGNPGHVVAARPAHPAECFPRHEQFCRKDAGLPIPERVPCPPARTIQRASSREWPRTTGPISWAMADTSRSEEVVRSRVITHFSKSRCSSFP